MAKESLSTVAQEWDEDKKHIAQFLNERCQAGTSQTSTNILDNKFIRKQ